jgi:hypothetical protein
MSYKCPREHFFEVLAADADTAAVQVEPTIYFEMSPAQHKIRLLVPQLARVSRMFHASPELNLLLQSCLRVRKSLAHQEMFV